MPPSDASDASDASTAIHTSTDDDEQMTRDERDRAGRDCGGGWQDQAGAGLQDHCVWFAEGIKADLDLPGEWFYDEKEATLYMIPDTATDTATDTTANTTGRNNGTNVTNSINGINGNQNYGQTIASDGDSDSDSDVVAMLAAMEGRRLAVPMVESLVRLEGSHEAPVVEVTIQGLRLR